MSRFILLIGSSLLVLTLTGCAPVSYDARGSWWNVFNETGYSSKLNDDGTYTVKFEGAGRTSTQRAADYALLRSAELCLENNKSHLEVLSRNDNPNRSYVNGMSIPVAKTVLIVQFYDREPYSTNMVYMAEEVKRAIRRRYGLDEN